MAGKAGVTAVYYNPALISEARNENFSFNANLFKFEKIVLENAFGADLDFEDSSLGLQPRFISFIISPKKSPRLAFEVASLTRDERDVDFRTGINETGAVIPNLPGEQIYNASLEWTLRYSDRWFGGGASYDVTDRFTVGASLFVAVKSLRDKFTVSMNAFPEEDTIIVEGTPVPSFVSNAGVVQRWTLNNTRLVGKLGMQYRFNRVNLGLNFTPPSANLTGTAESVREIGYSNIVDRDTLAFVPDVLVADSQEELSGQLKDPWSLALGVAYISPNNKTFLSLAAEYFGKVDAYKVIEAEVNPNITTPNNFEQLENQEFLSVVYGANEILNLGFGIEQQITKGTSFLGGFRTDFDYHKDFEYPEEFEDFTSLASVHYDVFHFSGGAKFKLGPHQFIAGVQYSIGSNDNIPQIVDFQNPDEGDLPETPENPEDLPLQGNTENTARVSANGLSVFLGLSFDFVKKD